MLNFSEIKTQVGNLVERTDSAFLTKIEGWINARYRYIVGLRPWFALLRQSTISTTSGQNYIILPNEVEEIIDIHERTNAIIIALRRYYNNLKRNLDSDLTTQGVPIQANPIGTIGVLAALPSNGTITMSSSSGSDTTQTVRIRGYNASLVPVTEAITLNGTSTQTSANTYTATEGYEPKFSKDSDTIGIVTITRGATTIATLSSNERESRYKKFRLFPVPNQTYTLYITWKKRIYKLENSDDTPELECDDALIRGAFADALREKRQFGRAASIEGSEENPLPGTFAAELKALINREPNFQDNFEEQWMPRIERCEVDMQSGQIGRQLYPSAGAP